MNTQDIIIVISFAVGFIISIGFKIIPKLDRWFYSIPEDWRGLSMVGLVAVASSGVFGLSCSTLFPTIPCTSEGAMSLLKAFLVMLGTNQLTNLVTASSTTKKEIVAAKAVVVANAVAVENIKAK